MLSSKPPYPILEVRDSKKHVLPGIEARKWVFQGRPPKKWPFFAQKWSKNVNMGPENCQFWATRQCFWAWVLSCGPPYPIFLVLDTKKHVLHGIETRKWVFQGLPTQKMGIFLPKNGLKCQYWA